MEFLPSIQSDSINLIIIDPPYEISKATNFAQGGYPTFNSNYDKGVYEYPIYHGKERIHPTQKPVDLIAELIEKHSNAGDTILDCFSGSCTTAVACIKTGRNFIGCELDSIYFAKSTSRITNILFKNKSA